MNLPHGLKEEELKFVGEGSQGRVYLLEPDVCIKVYTRPEFLPLELDILLRAKDEPQFPKVYEWGNDYMIREFFQGVNLKEYLRSHRITPEIARQLVELFQAFERLKFNRMDTRMAHIIITPAGQVKAIDPANAMRKSGSYPEKFLGQLAKRKCKQIFMDELRKVDPQLYQRWK